MYLFRWQQGEQTLAGWVLSFSIFGFFLLKLTLVAVYYMADNCGVVIILRSRVLLMSASAVMGAQCEKEGAEHTALGSSGVER